MQNIMDLVKAWERQKRESGSDAIDGHLVSEIVWETPRIIVFRDEKGNIWRRVHAWGMTWPVTVVEKQ
jgi:hypothetical protein